MRTLLLAAVIACLTLTVALTLTIIACCLLAIWGEPDESAKWAATAFVAGFSAIATGGAAGFMSTTRRDSYE